MRKGFSLIEVLVIVSILLILTAIAVPAVERLPVHFHVDLRYVIVIAMALGIGYLVGLWYGRFNRP